MLKKGEWIVFMVFLLFAFLLTMTPERLAAITGFAVGNSSEPTFDMVLETDQVSSGNMLKGYFNINFTGPFSTSTVLKVDFGGTTHSLPLKDYLKDNNINFTETESSFSAYSPSTSKMFHFGGAGSKNFAFKLPKLSNIDQFSMNIIGSSEAPSSFVSFDMEDYTGKNEWKYFGDFKSYQEDYVYPSSLTKNSEGDPVTLENNMTYFCESVTLPESKHFRIGAKLKKIADGADIKAILLSFDGEYAYGGKDFCDLPEPGSVSEWKNCDLSFPTSKQGTYLACVYFIGESGKKYYELSRDSTVSDSRFDCPISEGTSLCFQTFSKDYFIGVKPATYTGALNKSVQWEEGETDQSMNFSLTEFLIECKEDEIGDCVVPVTISSESSGTLQLGSLRIEYTEEGGASSYSDKFYDVSQILGSIIKLDNVDLSNASKTMQISLSEFNLTAPKITEPVKTLYLSAQMIPGNRISKPIKIFGEGYVPETGTIEDKVANAKKAISGIISENSEELDLFGITLDTKQLESFESEIKAIKEDKNISLEEIDNKLRDLENEVDTYLRVQPKSFSLDTSFKDLYIPEPGDVEKVVLEGELQSVYAYQSNVEVTAELSNYVLEKYNGEKERYSLIKKTVTPGKALSDVYVYEIIPKTIASSVADIAFKDTNYEVVEQDPIVRYSFTSLSKPVTIVYGVEGVTITQNMFQGLGSVVAPKSLKEVVEETSECGDGVCTEILEDETTCPADCGGRKIPWVFIIILVVLLMMGIAYINFYKGKGAFRKVIGKSPFAKPKDLENVKDYIKNAQNKGLKNPQISSSLLKSGWTKDQIIYAFEDLKWDEKRLFTIKLAPGSDKGIKKLQEFIKKCLELNMPKEKIRETLLQKKWAAEKVDVAFAKVGEPKEKIETVKEKARKVSYYFEKELAEEVKK